MRKVYTGVLGVANGSSPNNNTYANTSFYFLTVKPINWNAQWSVKYRLVVRLDDETKTYKSSSTASVIQVGQLCRGTYECQIDGAQGTYLTFHMFQSQRNTSYRPIYYHMIHETTSAGLTAGYGHKIGVSLASSYLPTPTTDYSSGSAVSGTAYSRTIEVYVDEAVNCEVSLNDILEVENDTYMQSAYTKLDATYYPTNTSSSNSAGRWVNLSATTQGLYESGDDNTYTYTQQTYNYLKNGTYNGTTALRILGNNLIGFDKDGNALGLSVYSSTQSSNTTGISIKNTRKYCTVGFDYTKGIRYTNTSTVIAANGDANISTSINHTSVDLRYSDNCVANANANTLGMVIRKPVYLRGTIGEDGLFYLAPVTVTYNSKEYERAWVQDDFEEGYVYWFIGYPYYNSSYAGAQYQLDLFTNGELLCYENGALKPYGISDTKNTAGATNSASTLYLIGSTSQGDNPQTYSYSGLTATKGALSAASVDVTNAGYFRVNTSSDGAYKELNKDGITIFTPANATLDVPAVTRIYQFQSDDSGTYNIATQNWVTSRGYFNSTGGEVTGDLILKSNSGDSPSLIFQRGTLTDSYNDWRIYDTAGILTIAQRGSGSTGWTDVRATIGQSDANFIGTLKQGGKAVATQEWVGNQGYTTNDGTITGVSVNGTSVATSGVAALTNIAKTDVENTFTEGQKITRTTSGAILELESAASDTNFLLKRTNGATCVLESGASVGLFGTKSNHSLQVRTNYTNRMTFDTSGGVTLATDVATNSNSNQLATTKWVLGKIPTVPTNVSSFANDAGYVTEDHYHSPDYPSQASISKTKIATGQNGAADMYVPNASASDYGLAKVHSVKSSAVTVNSLSTTAGKYYGVEMNNDGKLFVNVPWVDNNNNYYPTSFSWTNGTTAGPTGSLTGSGMSAVSFGAIPSASSSQSGVVTTGEQTFVGIKTFDSGIYIGSTDDSSYVHFFHGNDTTAETTLTAGTGTTNVSLTLPSKSGTLGLALYKHHLVLTDSSNGGNLAFDIISNRRIAFDLPSLVLELFGSKGTSSARKCSVAGWYHRLETSGSWNTSSYRYYLAEGPITQIELWYDFADNDNEVVTYCYGFLRTTSKTGTAAYVYDTSTQITYFNFAITSDTVEEL